MTENTLTTHVTTGVRTPSDTNSKGDFSPTTIVRSSRDRTAARGGADEEWEEGGEQEDAADAEGRGIVLEEGQRIVAESRALLGLVNPTPDDARAVESALDDLNILSRRIARMIQLASQEEGGVGAQLQRDVTQLRELSRKSEDIAELLRQLQYNLPSPKSRSGGGGGLSLP
jgi:hypothetical protein